MFADSPWRSDLLQPRYRDEEHRGHGWTLRELPLVDRLLDRVRKRIDLFERRIDVWRDPDALIRKLLARKLTLDHRIRDHLVPIPQVRGELAWIDAVDRHVGE